MATTIVTKSGSGAPTASDLVAGELAVDLTNKRLYTEDSGGTVIEVGSNPYNFTANHDGSAKLATTATGIDVTGTVTADGLTVDGGSVNNDSSAVAGKFNANGNEHIRLEISTDSTIGNQAGLDLISNSITSRFSTTGSGGLVTAVNGSNRMAIATNGDISFYEDTGTTPKFFWDASAESLGIGTSSPSAPLNVYNASNPYTKFEDAANYLNVGVITSNYGLINSSLPLSFQVNDTERMRIDASGRVGIGGVPNTNWRNDLANQEILMLGTEATLFSDGGVTTELWNNAYIDNTDTIFNISTRGASRYQQYQGAHKWWTAASASAGSDINTELGTTPKMTLDVNGDLILGSTASLSGATITTVSSGNTHNAMRNSAATAGKFWRQEVDNANIFYIINNASTGVYMNDGGTTWVAISDETVKENIVEIEGALDKVMGYRCVEYNLIADENKAKKIGFIAQDWEVDYSPVVVTGADGKLGMQYTETIPVLLKAIQEQQAIIESLTARIAALES